MTAAEQTKPCTELAIAILLECEFQHRRVALRRYRNTTREKFAARKNVRGWVAAWRKAEG